MAHETDWFHELTTDDAREARMYDRVWVGRVLCLLALLGTTIYGTWAYADSFVARSGDDSLTLHQEACPIGSWLKDWKKATWVWEGKSVAACWSLAKRTDGRTMVMTLDEDGEVGEMPMQMFRKEEGV